MKEPNPRRFALWAVSLVLPLVGAALLLPRLGALGARPASVTQAQGTARAAEAAAAASARGADAALGDTASTAEPPRRPEQATAEELAAARDTAVAAGKLEQRGWEKAEVLAPRAAAAGPGGEVTRPFQGFGLSIDSTPPGARALVNGRDAGETPLLTSVDCRPGEEVVVRLEARGRRPQRRAVACRADTLVELSIELGR